MSERKTPTGKATEYLIHWTKITHQFILYPRLKLKCINPSRDAPLKYTGTFQIKISFKHVSLWILRVVKLPNYIIKEL